MYHRVGRLNDILLCICHLSIVKANKILFIEHGLFYELNNILQIYKDNLDILYYITRCLYMVASEYENDFNQFLCCTVYNSRFI